jgi:lactoylglutathione lyase
MTELKFNNPGTLIDFTFIYFNDMPRAIDFYQNVLGFPMVIDQGWCKIYQVTPTGHWGLVDGNRGYHKASDTKPIMLTLRVEDLDAWYEFVLEKGIKPKNPPLVSQELGIRAFVFLDPEGHVIEIQSVLE